MAIDYCDLYDALDKQQDTLKGFQSVIDLMSCLDSKADVEHEKLYYLLNIISQKLDANMQALYKIVKS